MLSKRFDIRWSQMEEKERTDCCCKLGFGRQGFGRIWKVLMFTRSYNVAGLMLDVDLQLS